MQELIPGKALVLAGARPKLDLARRIAANYGSFASIGMATLSSTYGVREIYRQGNNTVIVHDFPATIEAFKEVGLLLRKIPNRTFRVPGEPDETWPTPRFILICDKVVAPSKRVDPERFVVYDIAPPV